MQQAPQEGQEQEQAPVQALKLGQVLELVQGLIPLELRECQKTTFNCWESKQYVLVFSQASYRRRRAALSSFS